MKIICILFHVGKKKNEITKDSKLRLLAGLELAKEDKELIILFVGGGGLKIPGAELMKNFWVKNFSEVENKYCILNSSNNTFDNLKEVQSFLIEENVSFPKVSIISNLYHKKRLQKIADRLKLETAILAAEEILISKREQGYEAKKYLDSVVYKKKLFLEWILRGYLLFDSKQRLANIWRRIKYSE